MAKEVAKLKEESELFKRRMLRCALRFFFLHSHWTMNFGKFYLICILIKNCVLSDCPQTMSPSARNSRISALENMLATSSTNLVTMASQLSEAEERERVFSGRGRWNQVRSLAEAKNVMNHLFNLASSSRYLHKNPMHLSSHFITFISPLCWFMIMYIYLVNAIIWVMLFWIFVTFLSSLFLFLRKVMY